MAPHKVTVQPLVAVSELAEHLRDAGVAYCHWKSNEAIDRSATADNDLDLLVARADAGAFTAVVDQLGFKEARPSRNREMPGLSDLYGYDAPTGRFVHVQAHYQLVLGDDMTKNFRLPIERQYLDTATSTDLFPLPAPDFELAIFIVRMVLKHATWDAQLCQLGRLSATEQRELDHLRTFEHHPTALADRLPLLPPELVERCYDVLCSSSSRRARAQVARDLETALAPFARRSQAVDQTLRVGRRALRVAARVTSRPARKRLVAGGIRDRDGGRRGCGRRPRPVPGSMAGSGVLRPHLLPSGGSGRGAAARGQRRDLDLPGMATRPLRCR